MKFPTTLDRYILKEHISPFIGGIGVLSFIMLLDYFIRLADLVVRKNVPLLTVGKLVIYLLAFILTMSVPMSVLIASLVVYGRMSQDFETLAAKSLGISLRRLTLAPLVAAFLLFIFMTWFNLEVSPESNYRLRMLLSEISRKKPISQIEAGRFTQIKDYRIFVERKNERTSELFGIKLNEPLKNGIVRVIIAKYGKLITKGDTIIMVMIDGEIHEPTSPDLQLYRTVKFTRHIVKIPISEEMASVKSKYRSPRERRAKQLLKEIREINPATARDTVEANWLRTKKSRLIVEFNKRISLAFAGIVFVLIAVPIATIARRGGYGTAFGISFLVFTFYYIIMIASEDFAKKGMMNPYIASWLPNIVTAVIGAILFIKEEKA